MWPNPQFPADLVTFTEEILNGKLHFLYSVYCTRNIVQYIQKTILEIRYSEIAVSKIFKKIQHNFCFQTQSLLKEIILKNKRNLKLVSRLFSGCQIYSEVFFL